MVLNNKYFNEYCITCDTIYTSTWKWCKPCQLKYLKENFTSKSEKIDNFIQEMQFKIDSCYDATFEWIPYNKFDNIEKIGEYEFLTVYSAKWKDGPLYWNQVNKKYTRSSDKAVTLKCLFNSQNDIDDFLYEV